METSVKEEEAAPPKRSVARRVFLVLAAVVAVLAVAFFIYVSIYYHADARAQAALESGEGVEVVQEPSGSIVFTPQDPRAGFIFYPGAKVEPAAYAPLMRACAERGVLCVLVKMPFNLALLNIGAADGVIAAHPEVQTWLLGGHSMGGLAAAFYLDGHESEYQGFVQLASYSLADLTDFGGGALCFAGTNDHVLNWNSYEESKKNLPASFAEYLIEGGNHAGFGDYGVQAVDGEATITHEEQQEVVVEALDQMLAEQGR